MKAVTDTQHYDGIANAINYSKDDTETYTPSQLASEAQALAENYRGAVSEIALDNGYFSDIGTAIAEKDGGEIPAKNEMAGRIEAIPTGVPPIFEQIVNQTATGVVASGEVKHLLTQMFCENTSVVGVILNSNPLYIGGPPTARNPERMFDGCENLKFVILPHLMVKGTNTFGNYVFFNCINLKIVILNTMGGAPGGSIYVGAHNVSNLVLVSNVIVPLTATVTFRDSSISDGVCNLYVPDFLKEDYKTATNWSVYANQFKGYSEAPIYDTITTYTIGDLCKYNNKLYAWINETDGNVVPTGDVDEYECWYCIANIEVGAI